MSHDEFRDEMRRAIDRVREARRNPHARTAQWLSDDTARGDLYYLTDALRASERFGIDAETVADALAIAEDY